MSNIKNIIIGIVAVVIVSLMLSVQWLYKESEFQKKEKELQTENASQLRKKDSLLYTTQILNTNEINDHLEFQNKDLKNKLERDGIKLNRIESIVSSNYRYRDTIKRETDITGLVSAIQNSIPKSQEWSDTTKCQTTKGVVLFDGSKLKVIVNDRGHENKSDGVAYWQRRQWNFLGIKTRWLGKKEFTSKSYDDCGETRIIKIEKKKNL